MKLRITILAILLILTAMTVSATDLADYPDFFVSNGKFNGIIVIGEDAPAEDVVSAMDITSAFPVPVGTSYLDSEIRDVTDYNAIVVGNPCENSAAAKLEGLSGPSCDKWLEDGVGYIKIYKHGNRVQVLVTGIDSSDRRAAAHVLARYDEFELEGFAMEIDGWLRPPKKYTSHVPYNSGSGSSSNSGSADLDDYPGFLLSGNTFNGYFVVGANAPATDVVSAIDIQTGLTTTKYNGKYPVVPVGVSKLDTDISDITKVNAIIVGHPDENTAAGQLIDASDLEDNKGYIMVFKTGSKYQVLVTGKTELDRRKAARALAQYKYNDLGGSKTEVTGTSLTDLDVVFTKQITQTSQNQQYWTDYYNDQSSDGTIQKNMVVQDGYTYQEPKHEVELIIHNPAPENLPQPEEKGIIDSMWDVIFGWI